MFLHKYKNKSIWDSTSKIIILYLILNGFYMLLNIIGGDMATYHKSLVLLTLTIVLTILMAVIVYAWSLKEQKKYASVKFSIGRRCLWVVLGLIDVYIVSIVAVIPTVILKFPTISKNQEMINATVSSGKSGLIYMLLAAVIAGPIIEECLNRFLIIGPNPIGNHHITKFAYRIRIIISVLIFTFLHMIPQIKYIHNLVSLEQFLLTSLPYLAMSIVFAGIYVHTQDIRVSIGTHIGHNLITFIPQLLTFI